MARITGCSRKILSQERERYYAWLEGSEGTLVDFRSEVRSDKTPEEWVEHAIAVWGSDDCTRPGEGKSDYDINPFDRTEKMRRKYLDVQVGDVVRLVQESGKQKSGSNSKYDDGVVRSGGFHMDWKMVSALRPYYVKDNRRETCLCWRCERWKLATQALYYARRALKNELKCDCANRRGGYDVLQQFMCSPKTMDCTDSKCEACEGWQLVLEPGGNGIVCKAEMDKLLNVQTQVQWKRYGDVTYFTKDGTEKKCKDFVSVTTPDPVLLQENKDMQAPTRAHYQHFKWCAADKKHVCNNVCEGTVHSIQDFSENGTLEPKRELQSQYFREKGYTLYGCVVDRHINDLIIPEDERAALIQLKDEKGLPHTVTETLIVISDDLVHDNAAVQHFNDKYILPYLLATMNKPLKVHYVTSDGCPSQYKCCSHFLWISKHQVRTTVTLDWSVGTPAHNKDMSDAECGGAKHEVDQVNMAHVSGDQSRHKQLAEVVDAFEHLEEAYSVPKKTLEQKGGRGVWRRKIMHHCSSVDKVNRRLPQAGTVNGSDGYFQFTDIGEEGRLRFRPMPCHQCECCMALNPSQCKHVRECGAPVVREIPTSRRCRAPTSPTRGTA